MTTARLAYALLALVMGTGAATARQPQYANPYASPNRATSTATDKGSKMDDFKSFATDGARILESKTGDLRGMGNDDALLVLDPPITGKEKLGEGPHRTVLLLVRDASGHWQKATSNDRLVPCATCGGVAGDPFGYVRIGHGEFTIVNGGGSRERWSDEYTFTYATDRKDWFVSKVVRHVSDNETGEEKHLDLTVKDFGQVTFHDFDPAKAPEVSLP